VIANVELIGFMNIDHMYVVTKADKPQ